MVKWQRVTALHRVQVVVRKGTSIRLPSIWNVANIRPLALGVVKVCAVERVANRSRPRVQERYYLSIYKKEAAHYIPNFRHFCFWNIQAKQFSFITLRALWFRADWDEAWNHATEAWVTTETIKNVNTARTAVHLRLKWKARYARLMIQSKQRLKCCGFFKC